MRRVRQQPILIIAVVGDTDAAAKLIGDSDLIQSVDVRDGRIFATLAEGVEDYSDLPGELIAAGHKLTLFKEDEINLETAFMALTKGITA
jgi:ABC-2 type transport system ATP-binding protein